MATRRTPADVQSEPDVDVVSDVQPEPDVDLAAAPSTDDEAAVVTGTWFKWDTSEGPASAAHGHVVVAAPHVIEQGVSLGLLTRL